MTLRNVALFAGLSDEQIDFLASRSTTRSYPKSAVIINEGDEATSLYVLLSGSVKVYLSGEGGKEVILSTQGPGEYFGELALFDDAPRSASVMTLEPCRLLVTSKAVMRDALTERPDIALTLLRGFATRVRILTENVRTLALLDVFGRLVRTLYGLAKEADGALVIEQRLTQQDLANRIGASREMVSRIMHDLVEGGYIEINHKRVVIRKKIPASW